MLRSAFSALLLLFWVAPAQAWTRAHVREADVELSVEQAAAVRVALQLRVEVTGGWLERLEIASLSALPPSADQVQARLVAEDGSEVQPEIRLKDGVVQLRFSRDEAPRRGNHRLFLDYSSPLSALVSGATDQDKLRLEWTLPGWEAGLSRASIHWIGRPALRALPDPELAEQIAVSQTPDERTKVSFERVHVPRETPWRVVVDVPAQAAGSAPNLVAKPATWSSRWQQRAPFIMAVVWVFLLALLARRHVRRWAASHGELSRSVLFEPKAPHGRARYAPLLAAALACLAIGFSEVSLGWALGAVVALTLVLMEQVEPRVKQFDRGPFEPLRDDTLVAMRRRLLRERLGIGPFQDAGSLLGALGGLASLFALFVGAGGLHGRVMPWALAASCGIVPLVAGARWRLPRSLAERVVRLAKAADALRLPGVGLGLVWRRDAAGLHSEPRLRVFSARPHQGLLRIDVMADSRPGTHALTLCAVVLTDSTAARALLAAWPDAVCAQSGSGKRMVFAKSAAHLEHELEELLGVLAAHGQRALESLAQDTARHAA